MRIPTLEARKRSDGIERYFKKGDYELGLERGEETPREKNYRPLWKGGGRLFKETMPLFCSNCLLEVNHGLPNL